MKKIFASIFLMIFAGSFALAISNSQIANAACASDGAQLFKIPAWYRNLTDGNCNIKAIGQDVSLPQFVWTVAGNIFDGIFRVAGVVAVGYIMYAGFLYMLSTGDSGKAAKAKTALTNAVVGLVISVLASGITQLIMGVF